MCPAVLSRAALRHSASEVPLGSEQCQHRAGSLSKSTVPLFSCHRETRADFKHHRLHVLRFPRVRQLHKHPLPVALVLTEGIQNHLHPHYGSTTWGPTPCTRGVALADKGVNGHITGLTAGHGSEPGISQHVTKLVCLTFIPHSRCYNCHCFIDKETEAQRGPTTCSGSHSFRAAKQRSNSTAHTQG